MRIQPNDLNLPLSDGDLRLLNVLSSQNSLRQWNQKSNHQLKFYCLLKTKINAHKLLPLLEGIDFSKIILDDVSIDIVDGCNLRCIGCPNSTLNPSVNPVPADVVLNRVRNIDVATIKRLRLYRYGEPLFNKQLPEILVGLKQLKRPKIEKIWLSTNAQHRNLETLHQALSTGLLDELCISADGDGSKESFEYLRPPAKFELLVQFIKSARHIIDSLGIDTMLSMGITLLNDDTSKNKYTINPKHKQNWKSQFGMYIDNFGFHTMLKMPGSALDEAGAFDNSDHYAMQSGACRSVVKMNVYVDGKGIMQPCCWAIDVSNLGDLNVETFSKCFMNRLHFKSLLDDDRSSCHPCSDCSQGCNVRL